MTDETLRPAKPGEAAETLCNALRITRQGKMRKLFDLPSARHLAAELEDRLDLAGFVLFKRPPMGDCGGWDHAPKPEGE